MGENQVIEEYKLTIAMIAIIISILSATVSWYYYRKNAEITRLSQFLQVSALKRQYFSQLQSWAKEVVETMSETISLCYLDPKKMPEGEFFLKRHNLYSKFSSLLDEGRWFFPNLRDSREETLHNKTNNKEGAFQGLRQGVLNSIAEIIDLVVKINYEEQNNNREIAKENIVPNKRLFVSEIQLILNPIRRDKEFESLTKITKIDKNI